MVDNFTFFLVKNLKANKRQQNVYFLSCIWVNTAFWGGFLLCWLLLDIFLNSTKSSQKRNMVKNWNHITWMNFKLIMLIKRSQTPKAIYYDSIYMPFFQRQNHREKLDGSLPGSGETGGDWLQSNKRKFWGEMKLFFTVIFVVVMWLYTLIKPCNIN